MYDAPRPVQLSERIASLDFLRGIAVLGILLINIESFAYPNPWSPFEHGFVTPTDRTARFWIYLLAQGKFFSMFTLLFGVGFTIFLERVGRRVQGLPAFDIYARRLLWLFVFGVAHAYLLWDGDILYHYAVCGFLLFPFRSCRRRGLVVALLVLASVVLFDTYESVSQTRAQAEAYAHAQQIPAERRSEEEASAMARWERRTRRNEGHVGAVEVPRQTYLASIAANYERVAVHDGQVFHRGILYRTLLMMLTGILLYRLNVFRDYRSVPGYWAITLGLLAVALAINYMRYEQWTFAYFEPVQEVWRGWLIAFHKELLGVAYVLVLNGLFQKYLSRLRTNPVSDAGRTALSNYVAQSVVCGALFYGYGLGLHGTLARHELLYFVAAIWIVQLVASWLWCSRFRYGPLEWLWRYLTYRPFVRTASPATAPSVARFE